jgi:hypothetical protein
VDLLLRERHEGIRAFITTLEGRRTVSDNVSSY